MEQSSAAPVSTVMTGSMWPVPLPNTQLSNGRKYELLARWKHWIVHCIPDIHHLPQRRSMRQIGEEDDKEGGREMNTYIAKHDCPRCGGEGKVTVGISKNNPVLLKLYPIRDANQPNRHWTVDCNDFVDVSEEKLEYCECILEQMNPEEAEAIGMDMDVLPAREMYKP
jgi:hypothetical protein